MKKYLIIALGIALMSCQEKKKENQTESLTQPQETIAEKPSSESTTESAEAAKKWLIKSIETHFSQENPDMKNITTSDYYQYKTDATNVDLDIEGSLTEKQFHDKWQGKFNTQKAGIGVGFLISGQDWTKIEVEKCDLNSSKNNEYIFDVILADHDMKEQYKIKVKIIPFENSFLISDVEQ